MGVVDGLGQGAVSRDGEAGDFTQGEMRFYLMDWHQTLLSFFIGVVGEGVVTYLFNVRFHRHIDEQARKARHWGTTKPRH